MTPENADAMLATDKILVIDFGAAWCGPCKRVGPIVEKFYADHGDKIEAAYADVGAHPALGHRFAVMGLPTILIFKNGKEVNRFGSNLNISMLEQLLN